MSDTTADRPASGLVIHQPRRGFRYSSDAFWLAGFALAGGVPARVADLGTGSGIVAALLARQGARVLGIDSLPAWSPLWAQTLADSAQQGTLELLQRDVREGLADRGPFDLVVSNPPFFSPATGPASADPWHAAARFEGQARLADFVSVACAAAPSGRVCLVLPTLRLAELRTYLPGGWSVAQEVHVGRKRALVALVPATVSTRVAHLAASDDEVTGWVARAVAPVDAPR